MKTLLLLRHAKSSWKDESRPDHDRPLNARGRRDALRLGAILNAEGLAPDLIMTSTARRARKTVKRLRVSAPGTEVIECDDLYFANLKAFQRVMRSIPETSHRPMLVGHNPGLEALIVALTGEAETLPTCATAHLEVDLNAWSAIELPVSGRVVRIVRPREWGEGSS